MKTDASNDKVKDSNQAEELTAPYKYLDESVKNFSYSDVIHVRSGAGGMLISFAKSHPENKESTIFQEILIPLGAAYSLGLIIQKQLEALEGKGLLKIEDDKK
jgi:hypothetical protein